MKSYMETRKAVKEMIMKVGIYNLKGGDLVKLYRQGHNVTNVQNAVNYFRYSPQTKKYRNV